MHGQFNETLTPYLPVGPTHDVRTVERGSLRARLAASAADVAAAVRLRSKQFRHGADDGDALDDVCRHVLVERHGQSEPVGTFRFLHLVDGSGVGMGYSAQFYDLTRLMRYRKPVLEVGRFCTGSAGPDADVLRIGWAVLTRYVDAHGIGMMFGCSSFPGTDVTPFADALGLLNARHLAPDALAPETRAEETVRLSGVLQGRRPDLRVANRTLPTLLRTYLAMGGWVSDHAVIDRDLGTFHVFTGVEIDAIPEVRKRLLRADAA